MEKMDYGLKAPQLDDGSLLLQELTLSADQTAHVKSDKSSIAKARKHVFVSSILLYLLDTALFLTGMTTLLNMTVSKADNPPLMVIGIVCLIGSYLAGRHRRGGDKRLALRVVDIYNSSAAAPEVIQMVKRYMPGDAGTQCFTYIDLLMKDDIDLGGTKTYRFRLDTSKDENYVVREVIVPEAA